MKQTKEKQKQLKEQLICLAAGAALALFGFLSGSSDLLDFSDPAGVQIQRPGYGGADTEAEIIAKGKEGNQTIQVPLSARLYTEEEAEVCFDEMMDTVLETLKAGNASLQEVKTDLSPVESLEAYPGISLEWQTPMPELIDQEGVVHNRELTENTALELGLILKTDIYRRELSIPVCVLPDPDKPLSGTWKDRLEKRLAEIDTDMIHDEKLKLPEEFEGTEISYSVKRDSSYLIYLLLGIAGAVAIGLKPKQDEKQKKKERETELLLDYSEIVSKLIVYIGAGLTVRNAWKQLADTAQSSGNRREVYKEILQTNAELENGESEEAAYMRFARRCDLKCYIRMVSLLEQNRKTGDSALLTALELEMEEAFEQRKNIARRLGEEAGTRLLIPLMISLVTVMVIVIVPAIMSMG